MLAGAPLDTRQNLKKLVFLQHDNIILISTCLVAEQLSYLLLFWLKIAPHFPNELGSLC